MQEFERWPLVLGLKFLLILYYIFPDIAKTTADTSNIFIDMDSAGKTTIGCKVSFIYSVYYGNYGKKCPKTPKKVDGVSGVFPYIRVTPKINSLKKLQLFYL